MKGDQELDLPDGTMLKLDGEMITLRDVSVTVEAEYLYTSGDAITKQTITRQAVIEASSLDPSE